MAAPSQPIVAVAAASLPIASVVAPSQPPLITVSTPYPSLFAQGVNPMPYTKSRPSRGRDVLDSSHDHGMVVKSSMSLISLISLMSLRSFRLALPVGTHCAWQAGTGTGHWAALRQRQAATQWLSRPGCATAVAASASSVHCQWHCPWQWHCQQCQSEISQSLCVIYTYHIK